MMTTPRFLQPFLRLVVTMMLMMMIMGTTNQKATMCLAMVTSSSSTNAKTTTTTPSKNEKHIIPPRHVCLFDSYPVVQSSYFSVLVDQLFQQTKSGHEKRLVMCTLRSNLEYCQQTAQMLQEDLELVKGDDNTPETSSSSSSAEEATCSQIMPPILVLEDHDPITLGQELKKLDPNMIWVSGNTNHTNAFELRYRMRTSGLDSYISELCGSVMGESVVYLGEGPGALCAGASMGPAHVVRSSDPTKVPEPQFFGLGLLGPKISVAFGLSSEKKPNHYHDHDKKDDDATATTTTTEMDLLLKEHPKTKDDDGIKLLDPDQVFVWSQSEEQMASFVYNPCHRGIVDDWQSPPPLPPLVSTTNNSNNNNDDKADETQEGVACRGEPSIDPSRAIQGQQDSEWLDEILMHEQQ